jgi:hypothetical protein
MTRRKVKTPRVVFRKLGREQAWGQATCDPARPLVEIDSRLSPARELEVCVHESLHIALPEMPEKEIDRVGKAVARVLWKINYRRVLLGKHTTPVRISK